MRVAGVTRRFGDVVAVDDVDLEIGKGEFVCLLGPSGCGKTTLLRIIAGFEELDAGEVWLRGRPLSSMPPERRQLGMVFQSYALFPHLTVFDNVAFPLRAGKWLRRRRRPPSLVAEVTEVLRLVNLEGFEQRVPSQLSGGQAQRVALARALVRRPDVVLLDEPLSALDLKVRQRMREELRSLHETLGTTFVLVTHDQDEALSMANRIALMQAGRIEQVAAPEELYREPASRFAAQFIGEQSFVRGRCEGRHGDRLAVRWQDHVLHPLDRANVPVGAGVDVMLRPEDLRPGDGAATALRPRVVTVVFRGSSVDAQLSFGAETVRMSCAAGDFPGLDADGTIAVTLAEQAGVAFAVLEGATDAADLDDDPTLGDGTPPAPDGRRIGVL
jgi:ABC-type Fe3+/spermidine/putrescine transport system ATPase subunit